MRLPDYLRVRRTRQVGRTVVVTLTADTSAFLDALWRLGERQRVARYRRRIDHERSLGRAQVGALLDGMCHDLGFPVSVWRDSGRPRPPSRRTHTP